jgi:hypothetical protein
MKSVILLILGLGLTPKALAQSPSFWGGRTNIIYLCTMNIIDENNSTPNFHSGSNEHVTLLRQADGSINVERDIVDAKNCTSDMSECVFRHELFFQEKVTSVSEVKPGPSDPGPPVFTLLMTKYGDRNLSGMSAQDRSSVTSIRVYTIAGDRGTYRLLRFFAGDKQVGGTMADPAFPTAVCTLNSFGEANDQARSSGGRPSDEPASEAAR